MAEVTVSPVVKDFVFDLHQAVRRSLVLSEVQKLYECDFREITDKYFAQVQWPEPKAVASECDQDEIFLYFYREVTLRHLFTKLKPQLKDFYESWNNYIKIFDYLLATPNPDIALNTQWIYELMVEFVYQFQGFCQHRCQLVSRNHDDVKTLIANPNAWSYPTVATILNRLIKQSGIASKNRPLITPESPVKLQFGFFASIELARLECLCGDHLSSLKAASNIDVFEHTALLESVPLCNVNMYYHLGISQLLLRRFTDAMDTFSNVILVVSRMLKPGVSSLRNSMGSTLNKIMDKFLALAAISSSLNPGRRIDDQVRDLIQGKFKDKLHKLTDGDSKTFQELFEASSPKFIALGVPDFSVISNINNETFTSQIQLFVKEVEQNTAVLKLRSYLRLYAAIEVSKLARFNDLSEAEFTSILLSFKHKAVQVQSSSTGTKAVYTSDVNFLIQDGNVVIDSSSSRLDKEKSFEKYFTSGIRKHSEILETVRAIRY